MADVRPPELRKPDELLGRPWLPMGDVVWHFQAGRPGWLDTVTGRWLPAESGVILRVSVPATPDPQAILRQSSESPQTRTSDGGIQL